MVGVINACVRVVIVEGNFIFMRWRSERKEKITRNDKNTYIL